MLRRWGMGPVFVYESMLGTRRWQVYAVRSLFVATLLAGMTIAWMTTDDWSPAPARPPTTFQQMAKVGEAFFYALAGIQLSLVMLAAPAAAAGSICTDRQRGTLLHMMVTDLSDVEIVLGKLGSRLAPVFGLIAGTVPVTALAALLGGIDFGALVGLFAVSMSLAVLGCALAMAVSVRATKTHEVLMAVYILEALALLSLPIWWILVSSGPGPGTPATLSLSPPEWFQKSNPFVLVFAPYTSPGFAGAGDFVVVVAGALGFSAALVGLTIARLRRAVIDEAGRAEHGGRRGRSAWERVFPSWTGPTLDGNPVLWREWHRNRPSTLARRLWGGLFVCTWALAVWGTYTMATAGLRIGGSDPLTMAFLLQIVFGLLMLSASAPTSLAEERARGSLDVLMSTPISTTAIVLAKWWGTYRRVLVLAILPLYTVCFLAATVPDIPAYAFNWPRQTRPVPLTGADRVQAVLICAADFLASGAAIVSLGLALATWVRRQGRSVALCVIAYFLVGIGWAFLAEIGTNWVLNALNSGRDYEKHRWVMTALTSISPIAGPAGSINTLAYAATSSRTPIWRGLAVAVLFKLWGAGLLYALVVRSFDRCLGRIAVPRGRAGHGWPRAGPAPCRGPSAATE